MKKWPPKNMAASVHQRLLNKAKEIERPFNELLQYYAMERFLYRLYRSRHADKFVLKGALMFTAWKAPQSRPTMDVDLLSRTDKDVKAIVTIVREVCAEDVEADGLGFDSSSVRGALILEDAMYEGVRILFDGNLGTAQVYMQLDIGFGDIVVPPAELTEYPTILDQQPPLLRGYSKESLIAEKFEAMVKLGLVNSRMKDFYDIWLLSRHYGFDGAILGEAISRTFAKRRTKIIAQPVALTEAFATDSEKATQWRAFVRKTRLDIYADLPQVVADLSQFLLPITADLASGKRFQGNWEASDSWS